MADVVFIGAGRSKDAIIDSFGAVRELFAEQPGTRVFELPVQGRIQASEADAQEKEKAPTE
jgi:hypothetical protein